MAAMGNRITNAGLISAAPDICHMEKFRRIYDSYTALAFQIDGTVAHVPFGSATFETSSRIAAFSAIL